MKLCTSCQIKQHEEDFSWAIKNKRRKTICKKCTVRYSQKHYKANKEKYINRAIKHAANAAENKKIFIYNYLIKHPCVDCGESDPIVLEFDHLDPTNKQFAIANAFQNYSLLKIEQEIQKCEVRCANCHRRKTAKQFNYHKYKTSIFNKVKKKT